MNSRAALVGHAAEGSDLRRLCFPVDYLGNQRVKMIEANRGFRDPVLKPGLASVEDVDVALEVLHELAGLPHVEWRQA